jgi:hypothetical protein
MASWRWRGVILLTLRSLAAFCSDTVSDYDMIHAMRDHDKTYASQLEDFGSQVFEDSGDVHGSLGADAHLVLGVLLQEALDTTTRELQGVVLAFVACESQAQVAAKTACRHRRHRRGARDARGPRDEHNSLPRLPPASATWAAPN